MIELEPYRKPYEEAYASLKDSDNWTRALQIIKENNFSNEGLLDLLRASDGNWIFAEYLVEKSVFDSKEMMEVVRICKGYWRIAASIIWTDKLNLSEMVELYGICRCDSDLWPNIQKRANFSELDSLELIRLVKLGKFGDELVKNVIGTGKISENEMWSIFTEGGSNERIAQILLKTGVFHGERLNILQKIIDECKAISEKFFAKLLSENYSDE